MFAPEGYVTISELRRRVSESHWERSHSMSSRDSFEEFVFESILVSGGFRLCSPSGEILKIESSPLIDRFDMRKISEIVDLKNHDFFWDFQTDEIRSPYSFWAIPLFFLRRHYVVSLDGYKNLLNLIRPVSRMLSTEFTQSFEAESHMLEPFEGWALVAKENKNLRILNMPSDFNPSYRENFYEFDFEPESLNGKINRKGRKPTGAREVYYSLRPDGKLPNDTWESLVSEIAEKSGIQISIRSLQTYEAERAEIPG